MKNRNRNRILLRILSKSNSVLDNVVQLTMQISSTQPRLNMFLDSTALCSDRLQALDNSGIEDFRNILIGQLKESELIGLKK